MRRDHPLLTAREDMGMATLLTVSEKDTQMLLEEMEQCYRLLKPDFAFRGNEIQTMSALLSVLEGLPAEKCEKVKAICDALKAHRVSLNFRECLPLAAGLIVGEDSPDQIAADIAEAAEWLRHKRGFSWLTQGKHGRITFSMLLYMNDCIGKRKLTENAVSTALSSIILMEVLITMLILLAPVTASASSDN